MNEYIGFDEFDEFEQMDLVSCETCLREIPRINARSTEVNDDVICFCGRDCYELWQRDMQVTQSVTS